MTADHAPVAPPSAPPRRWRDSLEVAIIVNQLATPGLGSWMAGHRIAGAGQLFLSCAGFGLYVVFFGMILRGLWAAMNGGPEVPPPASFWWQDALILFGIAWLWAGFTSIQLALELRRRRRTLPPRVSPPRISPT